MNTSPMIVKTKVPIIMPKCDCTLIVGIHDQLQHVMTKINYHLHRTILHLAR